MNNNQLNKNYYFISLGREPGGLLDFLDLPPNSSNSDIKKAFTEYRIKQKKEQKIKQKELLDEKDELKLTEEEFQEKKAQIKDEMEDRLARLNELNQAYDKENSQKRGLKLRGLTEDKIKWSELYHQNQTVHSLDQLFQQSNQMPLPKISQTEKKREKEVCDTIDDWIKEFTCQKTEFLWKIDSLWIKINQTFTKKWIQKISNWLEDNKDKQLQIRAYRKVEVSPSLLAKSFNLSGDDLKGTFEEKKNIEPGKITEKQLEVLLKYLNIQ